MPEISIEQRELLESMRSSDEIYKSIPVHGDEKYIVGRNGKIRILTYRPQIGTESMPVFFNFHGGGFVLGLPEADDLFCKKLSDALGIAVINVEYRLAPEFPFPSDQRRL